MIRLLFANALKYMLNENFQSLLIWACWRPVGEVARVSFRCHSTTTRPTAEAVREPKEQSSQQQKTAVQAEMWRERKRRRRRWRKYSHASGIRDLNVGSQREGEYDPEQALCRVGCIKSLDTLSVFTGLNVTYTPHYLQHWGLPYCGMLWKLLSPYWRLHQQSPSVKGWSQETI